MNRLSYALDLVALFAYVTSLLLSPSSYAQQTLAPRHIGVLNVPMREALQRSFQERGYVEGKNVTIDWTMRENVRAQLRVIIKRILRKYGYPPDKQEKATQTVLEQVELLGWEVAA